MSVYEFTETGETIAREAGLNDLVKKLYAENKAQPLVESLFEDNPDSTYAYSDETEELQHAAVVSAFTKLTKQDDLAEFLRGLGANSEQHWRYRTGSTTTDGLFPIDQVKVHKRSITPDALVLSGVVGLVYARRHAVKRLLDPDVYPDYGFKTKTAAAAFVGGYVLSGLDKELHDRYHEEAPGFIQKQGNMERALYVGGDFHGDFRITETTKVIGGIISPVGTDVEFAPVTGLTVCGYHSIEPNITSAMLEDIAIEYGEVGVREIVGGFVQVALELLESHGLDGPTFPAFGDYGSGDTGYLAHGIHHILKDKSSRGQKRTLMSAPYQPQSKTLFETVRTYKGIRFHNRHEKGDFPEEFIEICQADYPRLFGALLGQGKAGLGRSSIAQHLGLLKKLEDLLDGVNTDDADW